MDNKSRGEIIPPTNSIILSGEKKQEALKVDQEHNDLMEINSSEKREASRRPPSKSNDSLLGWFCSLNSVVQVTLVICLTVTFLTVALLITLNPGAAEGIINFLSTMAWLTRR